MCLAAVMTPGCGTQEVAPATRLPPDQAVSHRLCRRRLITPRDRANKLQKAAHRAAGSPNIGGR
jgi:hypothetical protein